MQITQVVPHVGNEASGPTYSVVRLAQSLAQLREDVLMLSLQDGQLSDSKHFQHRVYPKSKFPAGLWRSPALSRALSDVAPYMDIIHSHGLWVMPNVYPGHAVRRTNTPLIVSPRGTLSVWALNRSRWKKRVFWAVMQRSAIDKATCFHATAESEYDDIRRLGFEQPVCVIPNGVDIPEISPVTVGPKGFRKLLFLGRVHPVKGVDILLRAWSEIACRFPAWELEIVGPDNAGYLAEMRQLARDIRLPRVTFRGPLFGMEKMRAFQDADIYVLPTRTENFGMTVAEALATGTPAIVTRGAPWAGIENHGAGWWIDIGVAPLVACLEDAMECSPEQLVEMGGSGRQWMQDEFSWDHIANKMLATYRWICNGGEAPEWVRC